MLYSRQCSDPAKRRSLLLAEALGRRGLWQRVFAAAEDIRNAEFGTAEEVRQYWRSWQYGRKDALGVMDALTAIDGDSVMGEPFVWTSIVIMGNTGGDLRRRGGRGRRHLQEIGRAHVRTTG